jgi:hypothetical protein
MEFQPLKRDRKLIGKGNKKLSSNVSVVDLVVGLQIDQ